MTSSLHTSILLTSFLFSAHLCKAQEIPNRPLADLASPSTDEVKSQIDTNAGAFFRWSEKAGKSFILDSTNRTDGITDSNFAQPTEWQIRTELARKFSLHSTTFGEELFVFTKAEGVSSLSNAIQNRKEAWHKLLEGQIDEKPNVLSPELKEMLVSLANLEEEKPAKYMIGDLNKDIEEKIKLQVIVTSVGKRTLATFQWLNEDLSGTWLSVQEVKGPTRKLRVLMLNKSFVSNKKRFTASKSIGIVNAAEERN